LPAEGDIHKAIELGKWIARFNEDKFNADESVNER